MSLTSTAIKTIKTKVPDGMTFARLNRLLDLYIAVNREKDALNREMDQEHQGNGKIRHSNFYSEISENIAKFAYYKKHPDKGLPTWNSVKGDLELGEKQLEVKGFMSDGPSSFGPTEDWDVILFVDCKGFESKNFKVYEINLSNKSDAWRDIKISGSLFDASNVPCLPENIDSLKAKALRDLCEKRGLTKAGNKQDLLTKLKTQAPGSKFKKPMTYGEIADNNSRGQLRGCFETIFRPQLGDKCELIFDGHLSNLNNAI